MVACFWAVPAGGSLYLCPLIDGRKWLTPRNTQNDLLWGGPGDDILNGGAGPDTVDAGNDIDFLDGR